MYQMYGAVVPMFTWSNWVLITNAVKLLMPNPSAAYKQKCNALKLLPLDKHVLFNKCVLMQKVVHGAVSQYLRLRDLMPPLRTSQYLRLRDLMLPSGRLYSVQGHKQLIPRKGIDFLKTSLSFSGSHPLTTVMNLKTFGKKVFQQLKESIPTIP